MAIRINCTRDRCSCLVLEALDTSPTTHDERVVGSNDCNDIDAFRLELIIVLEIRREMVHMASRLDTVIKKQS